MEIKLKWGALSTGILCCFLMFDAAPVFMDYSYFTQEESFGIVDNVLMVCISIAWFWFGGVWIWNVAKSCFLTRIDENGIRQKWLRGWYKISWPDITAIEQDGFALYVRSAKASFLLTPSVYGNWQDVVTFIQDRTPPQAFKLNKDEIEMFT